MMLIQPYAIHPIENGYIVFIPHSLQAAYMPEIVQYKMQAKAMKEEFLKDSALPEDQTQEIPQKEINLGWYHFETIKGACHFIQLVIENKYSIEDCLIYSKAQEKTEQ